MQKIITTLKDRYTVKISNKLNQAKFSLSLLSYDILYLFMSQIQCNKTETEDRYFYTYNISLIDIEKILGKRIHSYSFEDICKDLLNNKIFIEEDSLETTFSEICSYDKESRIFSFKFNDSLSPYLLRVRNNFTTFSRKSIVGFRSIYSKRIYTLLSQFKSSGFFSVGIQKLIRILDLENSDYSHNFYDFKKRVIDPVKKTFEKESSINFHYKEVFTGKKVTKIEFTIKITLEPKIISEKKPVKKLKRGVMAVEKWLQESKAKNFESEGHEESIWEKLNREQSERRLEERRLEERQAKEFEEKLDRIENLQKLKRLQNIKKL